MTHVAEVKPLGNGLAAVYVPRGLPAAQERVIRERLGLICRHGRNARAATGRCPACVAHPEETAS